VPMAYFHGLTRQDAEKLVRCVALYHRLCAPLLADWLVMVGISIWGNLREQEEVSEMEVQLPPLLVNIDGAIDGWVEEIRKGDVADATDWALRQLEGCYDTYLEKLKAFQDHIRPAMDNFVHHSRFGVLQDQFQRNVYIRTVWSRMLMYIGQIRWFLRQEKEPRAKVLCERDGRGIQGKDFPDGTGLPGERKRLMGTYYPTWDFSGCYLPHSIRLIFTLAPGVRWGCGPSAFDGVHQWPDITDKRDLFNVNRSQERRVRHGELMPFSWKLGESLEAAEPAELPMDVQEVASKEAAKKKKTQPKKKSGKEQASSSKSGTAGKEQPSKGAGEEQAGTSAATASRRYHCWTKPP